MMSRDVSTDNIVVPAMSNPHIVDLVPKAVTVIYMQNTEVVVVMGLGEGATMAPKSLGGHLDDVAEKYTVKFHFIRRIGEY